MEASSPQKASSITIGLPPSSEGLSLYIDGAKTSATRQDNQLSIILPAGQHRWELSAGLPTPLAPPIEYTESTRGGAIVHGVPVASADSYILELSDDQAATWKRAGKASEPMFTLAGLVSPRKYHARLIAQNAEHQSAPSPEYPLYITSDPPPAPSGLHVDLSAGAAHLAWGEVLGITAYRVYRKRRGEPGFRVAYTGRLPHWIDLDPAIVPSAASPSDTRAAGAGDQPAFQYYVTAVSHIGESRPSRPADTDPASWRNWNPVVNEPFRRTVERTEGSLPNDGTGRYYPI